MSYERRVYGSVDDKSLYPRLYHKKLRKTELLTERVKTGIENTMPRILDFSLLYNLSVCYIGKRKTK